MKPYLIVSKNIIYPHRGALPPTEQGSNIVVENKSRTPIFDKDAICTSPLPVVKLILYI